MRLRRLRGRTRGEVARDLKFGLTGRERVPHPLHNPLQTRCRRPNMIRVFGQLHTPLLGRLQRRTFSVKAIYSSFPASLAYYSPRHRSSLFDHKENESRPDDLYDESIAIAQDGLVYPSVRPGRFPHSHARNITNGAE